MTRSSALSEMISAIATIAAGSDGGDRAARSAARDAGREARQRVGREHHPVAAVGVHQPARRGLQAEQARDERDQHDDRDDLGADRAEHVAEDAADRVGVLAAEDRVEVGLGEDQRRGDRRSPPRRRCRSSAASPSGSSGRGPGPPRRRPRTPRSRRTGRGRAGWRPGTRRGSCRRPPSRACRRTRRSRGGARTAAARAPTNTAPISSATKPAIANRPSVLVPAQVDQQARAASGPDSDQTVVVRVGVKPNSEPMKVTAPVDTLATVAISAQP